jgi:hypothetical protein
VTSLKNKESEVVTSLKNKDREGDLVKKQRIRGVTTSIKNKEPALNRGFTGECPTSDLAPLLV